LGMEARVMNFSVDSENRSRAAMFASEITSEMWLNGTVVLPNYSALQSKVHDLSQGGVPSGILDVTQVGTTNVANITITWQETSDSTLSKLTTQVILP